MPKEITHWLVSVKTAQALRGTIMGNAALSNQNALKFGAVFPDILFYLPAPETSRYRRLAHSLHGTDGQDTYDLIRQITTSVQNSPYRQQLLAFLLGVATHIQADAVFHPMIYYLTGNSHDAEPSRRSEAIQQHRLFESLMDIYFCGGSEYVKEYTVKAILKNLEIPLPQIMGLSLQGSSRNETLLNISILAKALKILKILQGCYSRRTLARLLYAIKPFLSGNAREIVALFYAPQIDRMRSRVSGTLYYKNPITGDAKNTSLDELLEEAVMQSSIFSRRIEKNLAAGSISTFSERGPSLSYGVIGATADQAIYFAEKPFFA